MKHLRLIVFLLVGLVVSLQFRLVLTVPPLVVGVAFLISSRPRSISGKSDYWNLIRFNAGLTVFLLGVVVSIVNLLEVFPRSSTSSRRIYVADYGTPKGDGLWISSPADPLGYSYKIGLKPVRSKLVDLKTGKIIYDVKYSFDSNGNRSSHDNGQALPGRPVALFLGGSFTFGEGLDDFQTLPSFFSQLTGWSSVNAGMHGYGTHQAYELLWNDQLRRRRTGDRKPSLVVYRMMDDHINRAAGRSDWDQHGPCFSLINNKVVHRGTFQTCKRGVDPARSFGSLFLFLAKTKEPWTRRLITQLEQRLSFDRDTRLLLALISSMNDKSKSLGAKFIVLNETRRQPSLDNAMSCRIDSRGTTFSSQLRRRSISVLDVHSYLTQQDCDAGLTTIPEDGHPSAYANRKAAQQLLTLIK